MRARKISSFNDWPLITCILHECRFIKIRLLEFAQFLIFSLSNRWNSREFEYSIRFHDEFSFIVLMRRYSNIGYESRGFLIANSDNLGAQIFHFIDSKIFIFCVREEERDEKVTKIAIALFSHEYSILSEVSIMFR